METEYNLYAHEEGQIYYIAAKARNLEDKLIISDIHVPPQARRELLQEGRVYAPCVSFVANTPQRFPLSDNFEILTDTYSVQSKMLKENAGKLDITKQDKEWFI